MADHTLADPTGKTENPKDKEQDSTPLLAAEIAKHMVAALWPQPEASSSKGKNRSLGTTPRLSTFGCDLYVIQAGK